MNVFLYIRVSTKEQAEEGYSIAEQEERLRAYAKSRDYNVVKVFIDPGYSGANKERPALQEMIREIKNTNAVLVYKLDRLSRSQKDTLNLIEDVFLVNNVDFISLNESFDTSTPFGRAVVGILSVFAQLDREQIQERLTMGRMARAKDGYYHGGDSDKAPVGYDYVDGHLVINDYEAECVKYIFKRYLEGVGYKKVFYEALNKFPGAVMDESTVGKILSRPLYIGKILFAGQLYEGRHKPIINKDDYDKVQQIRKKRASRHGKDGTVYLLTGLLYCGHCGARMAGKSGKKLVSGEAMKYYICYSRRKDKKMATADNCDKKFNRKEVIEKTVIDKMKKLNLHSINANKLDPTGSIDVLVKEVEKINNQISKLVELYTVGNIPMDLLTEKMDDLKEKKEKLLAQIEELNEISFDMEGVRDVILTLKDINKWSDEEQQMAAVKLIDRITAYNDRIEIDWVF